MKTTLAAALMGIALWPFGASATNKPAADPPAQQNRMKTCNAEAKAKSLKGDERKAFMSQCLKSK
jgi:psiF repeat